MIEKASLEDVSELNNLINSAYRGEFSKLGWTTEADLLLGARTTPEELNSLICNENNTLLKYTQKNAIIGCVLLTAKTEELYLGMLTVSPNHQNGGIGKKLLLKAELLAEELSLSKIVMTVISIRYDLINWYIRCGFQDSGTRLPFPKSIEYTEIAKEPLEFMLLEKQL